VTRAAEWIDYDPTGEVKAIIEAGHGPVTKPQKDVITDRALAVLRWALLRCNGVHYIRTTASLERIRPTRWRRAAARPPGGLIPAGRLIAVSPASVVSTE
jgi:hypothetical protein